MHAPAGYGIKHYHLTFVTDMFRCSRTILLAHAKVVKMYRETYRPSQKGKITMVCNIMWGEPIDPSNDLDQLAAQKYIVILFQIQPKSSSTIFRTFLMVGFKMQFILEISPRLSSVTFPFTVFYCHRFQMMKRKKNGNKRKSLNNKKKGKIQKLQTIKFKKRKKQKI